MESQSFSDGIGAITVIGATVRLDFMVYSATEKDEAGRPKAVHTERIVMGVDGFLRSIGQMQETLQMLQRQGLVRQSEAASAGPAETSRTVPDAAQPTKPATAPFP